MKNPRLPPKKDVVLALLENSDVFIHLDPRVEGVHVPAWFKKQPHLVLQIGLNMPVPIPDLEVDEEAVSCTLSFNRSPFYCHVPWGAVYALVGADGRAMVWPDDVPPEVAGQVARAGQAKDEKRAHLRAVPVADESTDRPVEVAAFVVESNADAPAAQDAAEPPAAKPKRRRKKRAAPKAAKPPPEASSARASKQADGEGETEAPAAEAEPEDAPRVGKSKRPLPPYLRIVK